MLSFNKLKLRIFVSSCDPQTGPSFSRSWKASYFFEDDCKDFDPLLTISYLICFVDELCAMGLVMESGNAMLLHTALSFYSLVSIL